MYWWYVEHPWRWLLINIGHILRFEGTSMVLEPKKLFFGVEYNASLPQLMSRALWCCFPTTTMVKALRPIHGAWNILMTSISNSQGKEPLLNPRVVVSRVCSWNLSMRRFTYNLNPLFNPLTMWHNPNLFPVEKPYPWHLYPTRMDAWNPYKGLMW